jgi:excisionase family DNA binding protein
VEIVEWLPVHEAAAQLGIARINVRQAIERGRLRAVRTRLGWLIEPASVADYARTRQPVRHRGEKVA